MIDWKLSTRKRHIGKNGYVYVHVPEHPHGRKSDGYMLEHRLIVEETIGRLLASTEVVHHINHVRTDNRPDNLALLPSVRHHNALHRTTGIDKRLPDQENYEVECECGCGQKFMRFADDGRARRRISGHYGDLRRKQRVIVMCACGCGTEIETPDKYGRDRSYLPGHNRETHFHAGRDDRRGCRWRGGRRVDLNPNKE